MTLTDNEIQVLRDLCHDDFIEDYGWQDEISSTWVDGMAESINLDNKIVPGVVASLIKKNLMWSDGPGQSCGFTDEGRDIIVHRQLWEK